MEREYSTDETASGADLQNGQRGGQADGKGWNAPFAERGWIEEEGRGERAGLEGRHRQKQKA